MNRPTRLDPAPIPFIDVAAQRRRLGRAGSTRRSRACSATASSSCGPEVQAFEADLAAFCGARHAIGCASGTDALLLVLMAKAIGPGDAVICPDFTFCRHRRGGGAGRRDAGVRRRRGDELQPRSRRASPARSPPPAGSACGRSAVIPVDLFGQPADHDAIAAVADAEHLFVLDDAAQAFGATYKNRRLGRARAGDRDELLSGEAARLLRRRRRGADRRRRARRRSCAACACTGKAATSTTACASASTGGSTPSRRRC